MAWTITIKDSVPHYVKKEVILDQKRTLTVKVGAWIKNEFRQQVADSMWTVYERCVRLTNEAYAKGLGFKDLADMQKSTINYMLATRLKDWLYTQRRLINNPNITTWTALSTDLLLGSIRKDWKLDHRNQTVRAFKHVFGRDADSLRKELVGSPSEQAQILRHTFFAVLCAMNLDRVTIDLATVKPSSTLGSASTSYGRWRKGHVAWDSKHVDMAFDRNRMEEHLVSPKQHAAPIYMSPYKIFDLGGSYADNLFGANYDNNDLMSVTLLHEASHMFAATEDHWYFEPSGTGLRADGVEASNLSNAHDCQTNKCVVNADSIAWFLFWYGGGKTLNA